MFRDKCVLFIHIYIYRRHYRRLFLLKYCVWMNKYAKKRQWRFPTIVRKCRQKFHPCTFFNTLQTFYSFYKKSTSKDCYEIIIYSKIECGKKSFDYVVHSLCYFCCGLWYMDEERNVQDENASMDTCPWENMNVNLGTVSSESFFFKIFWLLL